MKLKYIFAAGVMALLASCNESRFLDIKPQGTLNDDLLSSAEGVELLVTSAYAGLKGPNRDMHWVPMTNWTYGEVRSDNAYKGGGGVNDGDFCTLLETFKIDATWANADEKWFQLYCCLQRCNSALRVMNTLDENTLPVLKSRKAEMKVIRAHFFFELVRLFKQVPYFDENVDIDDYKYIPNNQFTREELLGKIAQEFLDAANDLPDTQSQIGRITKNIAYAYAAKTKLYQAYQQDENNQVIAVDKQLLAEVAALCDKVGAQGKAYDLLNDFQKLDQLEYENGVESVFAVQYSMDDETEGAGNINWSNLLNAPKGPYGGDGFFLPSQNLINAYKTDAYGLPLFDTFNNSDYGTYEGNELTMKEIKAEMDEVDYRLSELMAESETQNFTRAGTMFCLTTKTHASAVAGRKEELFSALRAGGFGDLVYETVNANSLSAFVKEQVAENGDMLPDWLDGLVNVFEKTTVGVRKAAK